MQKVEAGYDFLQPPAARPEDMTQPMGPLEEGDQALVDATHRLPEGRHEIRHEGGGVTRVNKSESLSQDIAVIDTMTTDGAREQASTLISKFPGASGISADISHSTAWDQGSGSRARVEDNRIGSDVLKMKVGTHRKEAQAIKLEVAGQINAAREHLGEAGVAGASK